MVVNAAPRPAQDYFSGDIDLSYHLVLGKTNTLIECASGHIHGWIQNLDGNELVFDCSIVPRDGYVVIALSMES